MARAVRFRGGARTLVLFWLVSCGTLWLPVVAGAAQPPTAPAAAMAAAAPSASPVAAASAPGPAPAPDCAEVLARMQTHEAEVTKDLRRLHRELAALRQQLENPGMREVFAGIGYILGLFGMAFFVYARSLAGRSAGKD